jgi:predicted N-acetyltransferase YhbS
MNIKIRREDKNDFRIVEEMTREAFWNLYVPGCDEHYLTHILRNHPDFIPEIDFVAVVDNQIVGNIMYTKSYVEDENGNKIDTLTFGPVSVLPSFQKKGIGSALIQHTIEIARKKKAKAIIILGHPYNYCKHGFKNGKDYNISDSEGKYPFAQLVLELEKGVFKGKKWKAYFSSAYDFDETAAQEFDKQFPPKKKEYKPSQEEFKIASHAYIE